MTGGGFQGTRIWRGIQAQDPPWAASDWPDLLAMAQSMLAARAKRFPDWVREGRMTEGEAASDLATFTAIAAHWRWIVEAQGEPAHLATLPARQAALDASLDTIVQIARDRRGFSPELALQAQHVIALRWHADLDRELALIRMVRLTREIRAALIACPTCERRREDPATASCSRADCGLPRTSALIPQERKAA